MLIGTGCRVHLRRDELPTGRLVVALSGHMAAVIDGVLNDTHDCSRAGTRCVYGYYRLVGKKPLRRPAVTSAVKNAAEHQPGAPQRPTPLIRPPPRPRAVSFGVPRLHRFRTTPEKDGDAE